MNNDDNTVNTVEAPVEEVRITLTSDPQGRRAFHRRFVTKVYVTNTPLHARSDEWFMANRIFDMDVKSKAWAVVGRAVLTPIRNRLAKRFGVDPKYVKWSRNCGCSCGCSPGWNINGVLWDHPLRGKNIHAEVTTTADDLAALEKAIAAVERKGLVQADWERHRQEVKACEDRRKATAEWNESLRKSEEERALKFAESERKRIEAETYAMGI